MPDSLIENKRKGKGGAFEKGGRFTQAKDLRIRGLWGNGVGEKG